MAALKQALQSATEGGEKIVQESDSFSAWLQWQCSVVFVVIFKAGKNTSTSKCVVIRGRSGLPRVGQTAASSGRKGDVFPVCPSKCSPGNGAGPWKAFYWLFYCKQTNKQNNHGFCLHYLGNNVHGFPCSTWDEKPQME